MRGLLEGGGSRVVALVAELRGAAGRVGRVVERDGAYVRGVLLVFAVGVARAVRVVRGGVS